MRIVADAFISASKTSSYYEELESSGYNPFTYFLISMDEEENIFESARFSISNSSFDVEMGYDD